MWILVSLIGIAQGVALYPRATIAPTSLTNYDLYDPAGHSSVSKVALTPETGSPGITEILTTSTSLPPTSANASNSSNQATLATTFQAAGIHPTTLHAIKTSMNSTKSQITYNNKPLITDPNVPTQWVPIPTSLAMPCYLQHDCTGGMDFAYVVIGDTPDNLRDPWYTVNPQAGDNATLTRICESRWSSSLVQWMKTAPNTHVSLRTTPFNTTIMPTKITKTLTTYWITSSTESTMLTYLSTSRTSAISWEYTVVSTTETDITTYTSTVLETTSLYLPPAVASAYPTAYFLNPFRYMVEEPCCGSCSVFGSNVQVFQWPTPAPSPPVSTLIDLKNNFTFVSPSIYVAFESIYTRDLCSTMGSVVYTTMAFSSAELSTRQLYTFSRASSDAGSPYPPSAFTLGTWGQPLTCTSSTTTFLQPLDRTDVLTNASALNAFLKTYNEIYDIGTSNTYASWSDYPGGAIKAYTVTYNPCLPMLSVPTKLLAANSAWRTCRMGISAFFDPPIFLTAGGAFGTVDRPTSSVIPYTEQLSETGVLSAVAGGSSLVVGSLTEGVSGVLAVSTSNSNAGMTSGPVADTHSGFQHKSSTPSSRTTTSTVATPKHGGERLSWILGLWVGTWIIFIGLL